MIYNSLSTLEDDQLLNIFKVNSFQQNTGYFLSLLFVCTTFCYL